MRVFGVNVRRHAVIVLVYGVVGCSASGSSRSPAQGQTGAGGATAQGGGGNAGAPVVVPGAGGGILDLGSGGTPETPTTPDGSTPERVPRYARNECPGALAAGDVAALAAPHSDPALRWLYPYDATVWPRGLLPPVLQWDTPPGSTASAVRVQIHGQYFDYVACLSPTGPNQLELPAQVWTQLGVSNDGAVDPIDVQLTVLSGTSAIGPIEQHWTFANAALKGAVFYNTYNSKLPAAQNTGAVLRLLPGAPQPEVFLSTQNLGECTGCHAVSAHGTRMAADTHGLGGATYVKSSVFKVDPTTPPNPPAVTTQVPQLGFGAFSPDGSRFVTNAAPGAGGPFSAGNLPGTWGTTASELLLPDTGEVVETSGIVPGAKMPSFSADGRRIVFTDHAIGGDGKGLAIMDFDPATNTFSGYRQIVSDPALYPGWAFMLPDGSGVVFTLESSALYTSTNLVLPSIPTGDLHYVDLTSGAVTPLARLNGFSDASQTQPYVPQGDRDLHKNFYSTGVPVAAGGYFWVFFTSRRTYGNLKTGLPDAPDAKQLWGAALDIGGTGDISHPAFYLRGQELASGNTRAFAALEPCRADGDACVTGVDCCGRFCTGGHCGPPPMKTCSHIDEGCTTADDCCQTTRNIRCIAGFCAAPVAR